MNQPIITFCTSDIDFIDMEGFMFLVYWLAEIGGADDFPLIPDGEYTVLDVKQILYN